MIKQSGLIKTSVILLGVLTLFSFSCKKKEAIFTGIYIPSNEIREFLFCSGDTTQSLFKILDTSNELSSKIAALKTLPYQPVFVKLRGDTFSTAGELKILDVYSASTVIPDSCHLSIASSNYHLTGRGFEPGWFLSVSPDSIFFVDNYGEDTLIYKTGSLIRAGSQTIITAVDKSDPNNVLLIRALPIAVYDPSGKRYPFTVMVQRGMIQREGWGN